MTSDAKVTALGPSIQLNLQLPLMKPSRFERWLNDARCILAELGFEVHNLLATKATDRLVVRIDGRGNCLTYEFDQPHVTALQAILGSDPRKELEGLVHGCQREQGLAFIGYDMALSETIRNGLTKGVQVGVSC